MAHQAALGRMYATKEFTALLKKVESGDFVEVETLKSWLYEIAMNNVGCPVKDFSAACEEIISRLDGLRAFERDRKEDEA